MRRVTLAVLAVAVSGCANWFSVYRPLAVEGHGVSIDAKQRVVASRSPLNEVLLCAEPSPDALSGYGSGFAGTLNVQDEVRAETALALAEQTASIGLRTQSIQLLRDAMYRTCEAYFSGAIKQRDTYTLLRRFQNLMLGLLAIEQLTGVVKPQQVVLTASAIGASGAAVEVNRPDFPRHLRAC